MTALAETNVTERIDLTNSSFYQDEYYLRLTKEPNGNVAINIANIAVATDRNASKTPKYRNLEKRPQVYVNGNETDTIVFNSSNWNISMKVLVTAIGE